MAKTARRSISSDPLPPKYSSDRNRASQQHQSPTSPTPTIDPLRLPSGSYYTTQTIPTINYTGTTNHSQPFRYIKNYMVTSEMEV